MDEKSKIDVLIDRYVFDTVRRLPKEQREDIGLEIRDLIDDMMNESMDKDIEKVLIELGEPSEMAKKYRDREQYLIGPEYFDTYILVMKIVWLSIIIGSGISITIQIISNTISNHVAGVTNSVISGGVFPLLSSFGLVTLIFAFLEHQKVKLNTKTKEAWTPAKLPEVPNEKMLIKRSDSIVSIVFTLVFIGLLMFAPQLFGIWITNDGVTRTIPVFNMAVWNIAMPLFVISLAIGLVDDIIRLVIGKYCTVIMVVSIVSGMLQIIIATIILKGLPLWNSNFASEMKAVFGIAMTSLGEVEIIWNNGNLSNLLLGIIIFATLLGVGNTVYKTLRFRE